METSPATPPAPTPQTRQSERLSDLPELAPVAESDRIHALDVVRGVALLGILLVNMRFFAHPIGVYEQRSPAADAAALDALAHWLLKIFCEGKFYPLYSMLFGMGLVLMRSRALERGARFGPLYVRRLGALFLIGAVHAFLLWYGDILIIYSVAGLVLLCFAAARARTLLITGVAMVGAAVFIGMAATAVDVLSQELISPGGMQDVSPPILTEGTPLERLVDGLSDREQGIADPSDPRWLAYETEAYREGPFLQALGFRAVVYMGSLITMHILGGMGLHVLGMFFIGAGLMKLDVFAPEQRPLLRRLLAIGLGVLPIVALITFAPHFATSPWWDVLLMPGFYLAGPLVSLGYLAAIALVVASGRAHALTRMVACAGRVGLTGYLMETVLATFVMYWWGLGLFGTVSPAEEVGLALVIYAIVVAFANVWLRFARFGPMEWAWRSATYLRVPRLLRTAGT
jgi:uncharacterized protein